LSGSCGQEGNGDAMSKNFEKADREKLVEWFNDNSVLMNSIVEAVDSSQLDLKFAYQKDEGLIHVGANPTETNPIFDPQLSPLIKEFFSKSKELYFTNIDFGFYLFQMAVSFNSFYSNNQISVFFVYTPEDIPVDYMNMYQQLEDNWYLYVSPGI
jgi:hypothetical protein